MKKNWATTIALCCGLGAVSVAPAFAQQVKRVEIKPGIRVVAPGSEEIDIVVKRDKAAGVVEMPKFWIGISGEAVGDALAAHLQIEHGVVISDVMDDSPASEAGLKKHDIVTHIGDSPVYRIADFFGPIAEAGDSPLKLRLLRKGDEETLEIKPAPRPKELAENTFQFHVKPNDSEMLFIHPFGGEEGSGKLNRWLGAFDGLDADVTIRVEKNGDNPAKIEVKRGNESWTVDEDNLDELPEDIREMVTAKNGQRRWLSLTPPNMKVDGLNIEGLEGLEGLDDAIRKQIESRLGNEFRQRIEMRQPRVERRLERREDRKESMDERLDRLTEMLESLQHEVKQLKK